MLSRRVRNRVDVGASDVESGSVGRETRRRPERRLRDHNGMIGIERSQLLVRADEAWSRDGARPIRVRGLVDSLVDAERRVPLQAVRDLREQLFVWRPARRRQGGYLTDLQPTVETVRAGTRRPINVNFFAYAAAPEDAAKQNVWRERLSPYYAELGIAPEGSVADIT